MIGRCRLRLLSSSKLSSSSNGRRAMKPGYDARYNIAHPTARGADGAGRDTSDERPTHDRSHAERQADAGERGDGPSHRNSSAVGAIEPPAISGSAAMMPWQGRGQEDRFAYWDRIESRRSSSLPAARVQVYAACDISRCTIGRLGWTRSTCSAMPARSAA
jgi:hypothetical protein